MIVGLYEMPYEIYFNFLFLKNTRTHRLLFPLYNAMHYQFCRDVDRRTFAWSSLMLLLLLLML